YRVFAAVGTLAVMSALPLWPLNADAVARGDSGWIRRTTVRMTIACTAVVTLATVAAMAIAPIAVDRWFGKVDVNLVLWSGLAVWWIAQTVTVSGFMVQNGAEILKPQLISYALLLMLAVHMKIAVGSRAGYEWIPWVGVALYVLLVWPA